MPARPRLAHLGCYGLHIGHRIAHRRGLTIRSAGTGGLELAKLLPQILLLLVVAAAMAVAAHLGFFALALTHWHWTLSATGVVALLLLAKILAVIVGHRRAPRKRRRHE